MFPVQPVNIFSYLGTKQQRLPINVLSRFYLSWEDGLWDIIRSFKLKKGSLILVPSFFCVDVVNNMESHGLKVQYYEVDADLQPSPQNILKLINKVNPQLIVLFHAVGIQNNCVTKEFIQKLPEDLFIIEDAVHRIVNPSEIQLFHENHICITSIRKVVPLQGSFLYANLKFISMLKGPERSTFLYSSQVIILWIFMQLCLLFQSYSPSGIKSLWGLLAEFFMLAGYDVIGDSKKPGICPSFFANAYAYIDVNRVKKIKEKQVSLYKKYIPSDLTPRFENKDEGELRGFPIIFLDKEEGKNAIQFLRSRGVFVRAELEGCPWTKDKTIIYLPMGLHIHTKDIQNILLNFPIHSKGSKALDNESLVFL